MSITSEPLDKHTFAIRAHLPLILNHELQCHPAEHTVSYPHLTTHVVTYTHYMYGQFCNLIATEPDIAKVPTPLRPFSPSLSLPQDRILK